MPEPQWLDRDLVDLWAYDGEENLFRLAAHLLVSLAKAHAYSDGNQRIAIISAVAFLGGNGIELSIGAGELGPQTIPLRCKASAP
jgi:prophage maintenance system killer protein